MRSPLRELFERAQKWPEDEQAELAEYAENIESRHSGIYRATKEELRAIDEAEKSGIATAPEVAAAFKAFRKA